jgi:CRISPR-associated protein Cmr2
MIRDYMDHELQRVLRQIEDLGRQEQIVREARGPENRRRRDEAEGKVRRARENLLTDLPPAAMYEFLDTTSTANAINLRTLWQEKNRRIDCLQELARRWKEGSAYYRGVFETPQVDLAILPAYSFVIQFTFMLAQSYISRDEQDFYIIDNPVRKDKIFGLPYVASTSWKGSLRAALWQVGHKEDDNTIRRLFGNEKSAEEPEDFRAGCLYFYPTFFTMKGMEIINPQDRESRAGSLPIPFESVPEGTRGVFTLLYVPFDLIGKDEQETRKQVAMDLQLVAIGLQAMLRTYGFGAKTSSGFGLAREGTRGRLAIRGDYPSEPFESFTQLTTVTEKLVRQL